MVSLVIQLNEFVTVAVNVPFVDTKRVWLFAPIDHWISAFGLPASNVIVSKSQIEVSEPKSTKGTVSIVTLTVSNLKHSVSLVTLKIYSPSELTKISWVDSPVFQS